MIEFNISPKKTHKIGLFEVADFVYGDNEVSKNVDWETVESFGEEWKAFNHFSKSEIQDVGNEYFDIVPEYLLNKNSNALDVGCGSGRWSHYVSERAKFVEAIDPSDAVISAAKLLEGKKNVRITKALSSNIPFPDDSFDFVFSLGVLHHIPDTGEAMKDCVKKLKKGGAFLVYLYYSFDNKSSAFKLIFNLSNIIRLFVCKLPSVIKKIICDFLALTIYLPFVTLARLLKFLFRKSNIFKKVPLWYYYDKTWNVIRNDSLDRFGTPLEQRYSKSEIMEMMQDAGLTNIVFSENVPYWHALGIKK